jgi:hypothetical protein
MILKTEVHSIDFTFQKSLFFGIAIVFFLTFISDITFADGKYEYSWLEKAEEAQKNTRKGFQQKTQISESARKYKYRYYPDPMVYYDIHRELYFYPEKGNWIIFESLPKALNARLTDYVIIEMDTDKPYLYSKRHNMQFPRTDSKKSKNNLWSNVIFMLFYEHATR